MLATSCKSDVSPCGGVSYSAGELMGGWVGDNVVLHYTTDLGEILRRRDGLQITAMGEPPAAHTAQCAPQPQP